ncbi:adenosine deaminase family protein [Oleiharenicola lentus]|uniref:adenosine deaminase family protein n=1 Tax=Oleiharenicola lentus TaxID=2508720 RepID=UPI003F67AA3F
MSLPDSSLFGFVQSLPKTETHLHVEGALPYELLHAWKPDVYVEFPAFRERSYRYETFPDFEKQLLDNALPWFDSAERYHEAAKVMFSKHVAENVKYVETSFHLPVTQFINVPGPEIIHAIKSAAPRGLEVRVFTGMLRSDISGSLRKTIDELHAWDELSGVDLHGFELMPTEPDTAKVWASLRAAGKVTKCHAGEFDGAARVREAIEQLGVTRIQHGVRASEDVAVMKLAADRGVTFDVCPISNVGLKVVRSMAEHPLRKLTQAGIRCTISTDDPLCFANSVNEEYLAISHELGFTRKELARFARNGFEVALMPAAQKQPWLEQLDAIIQG